MRDDLMYNTRECKQEFAEASDCTIISPISLTPSFLKIENGLPTNFRSQINMSDCTGAIRWYHTCKMFTYIRIHILEFSIENVVSIIN